jgi:hypothetical protein
MGVRDQHLALPRDITQQAGRYTKLGGGGGAPRPIREGETEQRVRDQNLTCPETSRNRRAGTPNLCGGGVGFRDQLRELPRDITQQAGRYTKLVWGGGGL